MSRLMELAGKIRAMPSARAATPSGLSRFASSCQHRIAIAWRRISPPLCSHQWQDGWAFANCVEVTIGGVGKDCPQRPVSWQVMQICERCAAERRRQLTRPEWEAWRETLLSSFRHGLGHEWVEGLPEVARAQSENLGGGDGNG